MRQHLHPCAYMGWYRSATVSVRLLLLDLESCLFATHKFLRCVWGKWHRPLHSLIKSWDQILSYLCYISFLHHLIVLVACKWIAIGCMCTPTTRNLFNCSGLNFPTMILTCSNLYLCVHWFKVRLSSLLQVCDSKSIQMHSIIRFMEKLFSYWSTHLSKDMRHMHQVLAKWSMCSNGWAMRDM